VKVDNLPTQKRVEGEGFRRTQLQSDTHSEQLVSGMKRKHDMLENGPEDAGKRRKRRRKKGSDNDVH
jgi:hypothetical protein